MPPDDGESSDVGHVDVAGVRYELPDGRVLLDDVSFRVGEGAKVALVGANGAGKTTLLRIITGDLVAHAGAVTRSGGLGVMRQNVGAAIGDDPTVADLLLSVSPPRIREAAAEVDRYELALMETDDEKTQMGYAHALSEFADAGGYDVEVTWDVCSMAALALPYDRAKYRSLKTLSGGEQKRLVLEFLLRGPDQVVLHYKIKAEYNDGMASQYRAAQTRLRKFEEAGPPTEQPREQQVSMRLKGGGTGKRAVVCTHLELTGLMK